MAAFAFAITVAAIVLIAIVASFLFRSTEKKKEIDESGNREGDKKKPTQPHKGKAQKGRSASHSDKVIHPKHPLEINLIKGHTDDITGAAVSSDGKALATSCSDGLVRIFPLTDVTSRDFKFMRVPMEAAVFPTGVTFGRGSNQLAITATTPKGTVIFFYGPSQSKEAKAAPPSNRLPPLERVAQLSPVHSRQQAVLTVTSACASHDKGDGSGVVVTCSEGTEVKAWAFVGAGEALTGRELATVDSNQLRNSMAAVSADGRFLAVAAFTADVKIWEVLCAKGGGLCGVEKAMQLKGHKSAVTWLCFTWDCKKVVTTSKDGTLKVWNIDVRYKLDEDPKCILTLPNPTVADSETGPGSGAASGKKGGANSGGPNDLHPTLDRIAIAPDDSMLAFSVKHTLAWMDLKSGVVIEKVEHAHDGNVTHMMWSSVKHPVGGQQSYVLVTAGTDRKVRLWKQPYQG